LIRLRCRRTSPAPAYAQHSGGGLDQRVELFGGGGRARLLDCREQSAHHHHHGNDNRRLEVVHGIGHACQREQKKIQGSQKALPELAHEAEPFLMHHGVRAILFESLAGLAIMEALRGASQRGERFITGERGDLP
jgi:hypothetical protein